jgi:hypothetical protein
MHVYSYDLFACRGQFFDKHLKFIVLNSIPVQFTGKDLSYLLKVSRISTCVIFCSRVTAMDYRCDDARNIAELGRHLGINAYS